VRRLHRDERLTVVFVTHLLEDVANLVQHIALIDRDDLHVGRAGEILTGGNLSRLYRVPMKVSHVHGQTIILSGDAHRVSE
jgi:ABC-type cobalamin/Fe3+-siderophores transport system ATPase subunit